MDSAWIKTQLRKYKMRTKNQSFHVLESVKIPLSLLAELSKGLTIKKQTNSVVQDVGGISLLEGYSNPRGSFGDLRGT